MNSQESFSRKNKSQFQQYKNIQKHSKIKSFHSDAFKTKYDVGPPKISNGQIPFHYPYFKPITIPKGYNQTINVSNPQMYTLYSFTKRQGFVTLSHKKKNKSIQDFVSTSYLSGKSKKYIINRFKKKNQLKLKWFQNKPSSRENTRNLTLQFAPLGLNKKRSSSKKYFEEKREQNRINSQRVTQLGIGNYFKQKQERSVNIIEQLKQNSNKIRVRRASRSKSSFFQGIQK